MPARFAPMPPLRWLWPLLVAGCALFAPAAHADLTDEIQVYDDSINRAGQLGLELHVNTTLQGRSEPEWPGELPPNHGFRTTMEWSYGVSNTLEAGLYLPFVRTSTGSTYFPGPRFRIKWIPHRPADGGSGTFYGLNIEVSAVNGRFEQGRPAVEFRPIVGYRSPLWLISFNPVIDLTRHSRYVSGRPDFNPGLKVARTVAAHTAVGLEYYNDFGAVGNFDPPRRQNQQLFAALDVTGGALPFNLGIGHGLNHSSDKWTLKAIFEVPLD